MHRTARREGGLSKKELHFKWTIPSHPRSICPLRCKASLMRSGRRPFKSTDARQPWNPSLDATSFGRLLYIPWASPAMYRSPKGKQIGDKESPRKSVSGAIYRYIMISIIKSLITNDNLGNANRRELCNIKNCVIHIYTLHQQYYSSQITNSNNFTTFCMSQTPSSRHHTWGGRSNS